MPTWLTAIGPLLKGLMEGLSKLFIGLFLVKHGEQTKELEQDEQELKNVEKAADIKSRVLARRERNRKMLNDNLPSKRN